MKYNNCGIRQQIIRREIMNLCKTHVSCWPWNKTQACQHHHSNLTTTVNRQLRSTERVLWLADERLVVSSGSRAMQRRKYRQQASWQMMSSWSTCTCRTTTGRPATPRPTQTHARHWCSRPTQSTTEETDTCSQSSREYWEYRILCSKISCTKYKKTNPD